MRISDWSSDVCSSDLAGIPAGQDGLNLSTEDFVATAGIRNLYTRDRAIFSAAKQYGVSIDMRYQVAPRMELFSGLTYTKRKLPTRELSIQIGRAYCTETVCEYVEIWVVYVQFTKT